MHVMQRKNWVDSHVAFDQCGLAESCHSLFRATFLRWTDAEDIGANHDAASMMNDGDDAAFLAIGMDDGDEHANGPSVKHEYVDMDWTERNRCAKRD
eukprot:8357800-Heterocapsa_arctica.AAC.1